MADCSQPHAPMGHQHSPLAGVVTMDTKPIIDPHQHLTDDPHTPVGQHQASATAAAAVAAAAAVGPTHFGSATMIDPSVTSGPTVATMSTTTVATPTMGSGESGSPNPLTSSPQPGRRSRFKWLPDYELTVFNSFRDSIQAGLQGESTMRPEAWTRALNAIHAAHGIPLLKRQIVSKFDNTKSKYRAWCSLKKEPGFTFDAKNRRMISSTECWDRYIRAHPEAACFRTAPLEHEELLDEIYSRVAFYSPQRPPPSFAIMQVQPQQALSATAAAAVAASASADALSSPLQGRPNLTARPAGVGRSSLGSSESSVLSRPSEPEPPSSGLSACNGSIPSPSTAGLLSASTVGMPAPAEGIKWVEQAMDIFLVEFPDEEPAMQLRALRKFDSLANAMMFCKVPTETRRLWLEDVRVEARNEIKGSVGHPGHGVAILAGHIDPTVRLAE